MSEPPEEHRPDGDGVAEGPDEQSATESGSDHGDVPMSDTGVGLSTGEANTFEPEEAGPAAGGPGQ
jgi:hypothetical protein